MKVFVSYTSKDPAITDEKLILVESRIKSFSEVFIDRLHNEEGNQRRVDKELSRCDVVLQIISPQYHSEWVQREILTARKKEKPVIKIGIEELLKMDEEQVYLLVSDVDKKGWSVWAILIVSLLVCLAVSIVGICLSYWFVSNQNIEGTESSLLNARGLFGDSWGGVNAIISAFAFAGVIVTLFLQNRDLNLQRREMARQREEFAKENETLKYQRFENLFYNMLNLHQEIVAALRFDYKIEDPLIISPGVEQSSGPNYWKSYYTVAGREVFRYTFEEAKIEESGKDEYDQRREIRGYRGYLHRKGLEAYDNTWIPTYYDHYFRHLYKMVQFVDSQGFPFDVAYKYISLLRGTLSRYELVWLYYNALTPSFVKFKKLIEKYSLLKNIREDLLSRCAETERYLAGLGLIANDVISKGFSGRDFEFYLTDNREDTFKYYLSAFWKQEEIEAGISYLNRWNAFIEDVASKIIK